MKLGRILDLLFGSKIPKVEQAANDGFVEELVAIANKPVPYNEIPIPFPWVQWKCPECEGQWVCPGYSRDFIPIHCTYCGVKFEPPLESELRKANFIYQKQEKASEA
jgi:hypothetical protein